MSGILHDSIVVGAMFGDEGKGLVTSYLCEHSQNPIVVRFSGGAQAGHTVVMDGKRHVFSSFGSGTLQEVPTYWSDYCAFDPAAMRAEYKALEKMGLSPRLKMHPLCPVVTPYDIAYNRQSATMLQNGTVGSGVGTTWQREADHYHLYVQDLYYPSILHAKLKSIQSYYSLPYLPEQEIFISAVAECLNQISHEEIVGYSVLEGYTRIYEGSQGILLDQDFGLFPNVTRSNTTSKNAHAINNSLTRNAGVQTEVFYVTRCYQTRHGNGFMSDERALNLVNTANETNVSHAYQGEFRMGLLDLDLLQYSLLCDSSFSSSAFNKNVILTCRDQIPSEYIPCRYKGAVQELLVEQLRDIICNEMKINACYLSNGPSLNDLRRLRS